MAKSSDDLTPTTVRLPTALLKAVKVHCAKSGTSIQEFAATAFQSALKKASK